MKRGASGAVPRRLTCSLHTQDLVPIMLAILSDLLNKGDEANAQARTCARARARERARARACAFAYS